MTLKLSFSAACAAYLEACALIAGRADVPHGAGMSARRRFAGVLCAAVVLWTLFTKGEGTAAVGGALRGARWFLGCGDWVLGLRFERPFGYTAL